MVTEGAGNGGEVEALRSSCRRVESDGEGRRTAVVLEVKSGGEVVVSRLGC